MSIKVKELDELVVKFIQVLQGSVRGGRVVWMGNVDVYLEISSAKEIRKGLLDLLVRGVEEI